jgi:hypothetical protein
MRCHLNARRDFAVSQANFALGNLGEGVVFDYRPGMKNYDDFFEAIRQYLEKQPLEF